MRAACTLSLLCLAGTAFPQQIPFDSVAQVLEDLRSDPEVQFRQENGWQIAEGHFTIWTFTLAGHPAHPAVIERRTYEEDGAIKIGTRTICTAEPELCRQFVEDFASNEQDTSARIDQPGVSLLVPDKNTWTVSRRTSTMLVLRKRNTPDNHSLVGAIQLERLPPLDSASAFLSFVQSQTEGSLGSDPRVQSPEISELLTNWNGHTCVAFEYRYVDSGAIQSDGSTEAMQFANNGIRCQHPSDPTIGVRVSYSVRYVGELDFGEFDASADAFIQNVSLQPFR